MTFKLAESLIFVCHNPILETFNLDIFYKHICILYCLAIKVRLADNFFNNQYIEKMLSW